MVSDRCPRRGRQVFYGVGSDTKECAAQPGRDGTSPKASQRRGRKAISSLEGEGVMGTRRVGKSKDSLSSSRATRSRGIEETLSGRERRLGVSGFSIKER